MGSLWQLQQCWPQPPLAVVQPASWSITVFFLSSFPLSHSLGLPAGHQVRVRLEQRHGGDCLQGHRLPGQRQGRHTGGRAWGGAGLCAVAPRGQPPGELKYCLALVAPETCLPTCHPPCWRLWAAQAACVQHQQQAGAESHTLGLHYPACSSGARPTPRAWATPCSAPHPWSTPASAAPTWQTASPPAAAAAPAPMPHCVPSRLPCLANVPCCMQRDG